jgi:hypothetical protein
LVALGAASATSSKLLVDRVLKIKTAPILSAAVFEYIKGNKRE